MVRGGVLRLPNFVDNNADRLRVFLATCTSSHNLEPVSTPVLYLTDKSRREIILEPRMWRITLNCVLDETGEIKVTTADGLDVTTCLDFNSKEKRGLCAEYVALFNVVTIML